MNTTQAAKLRGLHRASTKAAVELQAARNDDYETYSRKHTASARAEEAFADYLDSVTKR